MKYFRLRKVIKSIKQYSTEGNVTAVCNTLKGLSIDDLVFVVKYFNLDINDFIRQV